MKTKHSPAQLGIWMDHAQAKIIFPDSTIKEIKRKHHSTNQETTRLGNFRATDNEVHALNTKVNEEHEFYNELSDVMKNYDEVLLFGPTTASHELQNYIHEHKKHLKPQIKIQRSDYLSDNQMMSYVSDYFGGKE